MARPKEHPEQHIVSVEAARRRFLSRCPQLEGLLTKAALATAVLDVLRWKSESSKWSRRWAKALEGMPQPPLPPSAGAQDLLAQLGFAREVEMIHRHQELAAVMKMVSEIMFPAPTAPDVRDARALLARIAIGEARERGSNLLPRDLVLLEVATGIAKPTKKPDEAEYANRLEAAKERLKRARNWLARLGGSVLPDPGLQNPST